MIKYKIFHFGYGGQLYTSEYIFDMEGLEFDTEKDSFDFLKTRDILGELRKDLVFTVLPVYKSDITK